MLDGLGRHFTQDQNQDTKTIRQDSYERGERDQHDFFPPISSR